MFSLLSPLRLSLRIIPDNVHAVILARCFNHLLRGQALVNRLTEIDGKTIRIRIRDAGTHINFRIRAGRLHPALHGRPDVIISGNVMDLWQLATRRQDPDTLFFKRSLTIEGETETGVHIKNLLDALEYDWDAHFDAVLLPPLSTIAKQLRKRVCSLNRK